MTNTQSPFRSFWMGGFECADHVNAFGERVDLTALTRHEEFLAQDYAFAVACGMRTVREGIRWSRVETSPYRYDWSAVERSIAMAAAAGVQVIWDICHFGYPDDLTPLHPLFARRFAAICEAFARLHLAVAPGAPLIVTPMNEVGFISWLGGDARGTVPYTVGMGWEVKYRLMKAYIEGVEALVRTLPSVRILTTEPLVNITCAPSAPAEHRALAGDRHEHQFQVLDMLSGRMCPELRGRPEYLDLIGLNFYYNNQWVLPDHEFICWKDAATDLRWCPLRDLLAAVHRRYGRTLVLTETSHPLEDRPLWMDMVAQECQAAIQAGVPLRGICWYPLIDRPDWDHPERWHAAGIAGPADARAGRFARVVDAPTAAALARAQELLGTTLRPLPGAAPRARAARQTPGIAELSMSSVGPQG